MEKESIVIVSNYYPPEMGAAANRIKNLAEGLYMEGKNVTVLCPLPNYPKGSIFSNYKGKFSKKETINGIIVKRYWLYPSNSKSAVVRLFSMLSFAFTLWVAIFGFLKKRPNLFIIQSPPLFIALSGLVLSKVLRCKNVLNVSDLWPLSGMELGMLKKGQLYSLLEKVEKMNYRLADKIMGQSNEIISHINQTTNKDFLVYRNVPAYKECQPKIKNKEKLTIVYAGLLGYAQGIYKICKEIDFKKLDVEFHIYGAGMEEEDILKYLDTKETNIFFHGSKSSSVIKQEIIKYDVAMVPLRNSIYGAVPSKIFELMQLGVPILLSCKGEGAKIVLKNNLGLVNNPGCFASLEKNIIEIQKMNDTDYFNMSSNCIRQHKENYKLEYQLNKLIRFIK